MTSQESEPNTFNTDNISLIVTKGEHCKTKFDIRVHPVAVEAAYQKAIKNINKEISIPGFRKGKAPEAFLHKKYQSVIQKEFVDLVLQTAFNEAVHLTHLHPFKDGYMERPVVHECVREKEAHFTIVFETRPHIPSIDLKDLVLKKVEPSPVTETDRQNALQNLLLQFATYEPIEGRAVQEDDFVDISVSILDDPPKEVIQNQRTQVNPSGLPAWLLKKVLGLQTGESAQGTIEQEAKDAETHSDFQPKEFLLTIHAIWKGTIPNVDEDLAKKVGLQTIEEIYDKINERLEQEIEAETFKKKITELERILLEKYPFDIPGSYIDTHNKTRMKRYTDQENMMYSKEEFEKIEKLLEESTIQQLKLFFLLHKIASDFHISANQDEVSYELKRQIALLPSGRSTIDLSDKENLYENLQNLALDRKIKEFLIENAHIEDENSE